MVKKEKNKFEKFIEEKFCNVEFVGTIDERIDELKEEIKSLKESKNDNHTHTAIMTDNLGVNIRITGTEKGIMIYKKYMDNKMYLPYKKYVKVMKKIFFEWVANDMNLHPEIKWVDFQEKYNMSAQMLKNNLKGTNYKSRSRGKQFKND